MDDAALAAVGMTPEKLEEVFSACVAWTVTAWAQSKRDAAASDIAYEDACERADPNFYPRHKFFASGKPQSVRALNKAVETRYPVLPVFVDRWSPRSFAARPPENEKLRSLFEAARLAPSAHNTQPARFLLLRKEHGAPYQRLFHCLSEGNQVWAHSAPVLILASGTRQRYNQGAARYVPYPHFLHDVGLAVMSLILQAQAQGLHCHPMAGFDPDLAREAFAIPDLFEPVVVIAVGYLGQPDDLPEQLKARELAQRTRKPLEEVVFEGAWGQSSSLFEP
jgi:nitroreductase